MNELQSPPKFTLVKNTVRDTSIVLKRGIPKNRVELGFRDDIVQLKNRIESIPTGEWNRIRKQVNPFDFPNIQQDTLTIFIRAFYKLWEIIHEYKIQPIIGGTVETLHLAEAPGGFLHAMSYYFEKHMMTLHKENGIHTSSRDRRRGGEEEEFTIVKKKKKKEKRQHTLFTMTLLSAPKEHGKPPKFNASIMHDKHVVMLKGIDGTGNICHPENITHLIEQYYMRFPFITGDGSMDELGRYDVKEQLHLKLIMAQIILALNTQQHGGTFILKIYDMFTYTMVSLLQILTYFYREVSIYKPLTSRITNSEKYVICQGYTLVDKDALDTLTLQFLDILSFSFQEEKESIRSTNALHHSGGDSSSLSHSNEESPRAIEEYVHFEMDTMDDNLVQQICEMNHYFLQLQTDSIAHALEMTQLENHDNDTLRHVYFEQWKTKYAIL